MARNMPFDAIDVGTELGPVETDVSPRAIAAYQKDWDDPNPWYRDASPFGAPIAPPAFMAGLTGFQLLATKFNTRATIGVKTAHENLAPLPVGQPMITTGLITGKYIKRGREYVVVESTTSDATGAAFRRSADHIMLSFEPADAPDSAEVPESSVVPWRPDDNVVLPRKSTAGAIESRGKTTKKVVYQRALERSTFSDDSSHNDTNAQRFGYPGALVSAYVLAGLMSEPMVDFFGASWFTTGAISLTFIGKGVQQGDEVVCRAAPVATELCDEGARIALDISMEKDGVVAVAGCASGVLRDDAPTAHRR
jgi:hypothetical protein